MLGKGVVTLKNISQSDLRQKPFALVQVFSNKRLPNYFNYQGKYKKRKRHPDFQCPFFFFWSKTRVRLTPPCCMQLQTWK